MNKRKLVSYRILLLVALALLIASGYFYWTKGVYVSITNSTQNTLKHIDIIYSGGIIDIPELAPSTSCGQYINPDWESDLTLEWFDSSGAKHSHTIGEYIEHNYAGSVEITLEPDNKVSVTSKIRLMPWPL